MNCKLTIEQICTMTESPLFDRKSPRIDAKTLAIHLIAFANADGGGRRAAGQREQRLDGDWRRSLSKFADRPDGYGVGGRIYRFMGRGREKES